MTIRNAVETRLSETLELYELEQANPMFPDTLTHEYFYGKCMGIIDMALSLGMDEDELTELYEPYRLRLLALHSASKEAEGCEPEAIEISGSVCEIEELEDMEAFCETWTEDGWWYGCLYGDDISTEYHEAETEDELLTILEARAVELIREWDEVFLTECEDYTIEDELADMEFEAARERRYGYDD